ncbi:unnamed protein product [Sphagnum troendelagicum]|uniref:Phytocyanin domain-containing protein n=1 Tax=Sphagnum jensenii TaxID=128206 RepID=A0ABP0VZU7_9BRYO
MTGHNVSFYSAWAADKKFQLGDNLVFEFPTGSHDVLQLRNFADFNACNTNNAISIHYTGHTVIPLLTMGSLYFVCGIPGHCLQGMKLEVIVMEAAGTSPKTAANSSSFSQGPSPPSNVPVDISSPHQGNVAILQPVTLLLSMMASLLGCVALLF